MSDAPKVLPTLIVEPDEPEDEPLEDWEALMAALPSGTLTLLHARGLTMQDVLDGKVPWLDVDELLARAAEHESDDDSMWSSCTR